MILRHSTGTLHQYIKRILSRFSIFIRAPENADLDWRTYLKPFSYKLWLSVAAAVPIFAILLSTAQYSEHILRHEDRDSSEAHFTFYNSIFYMFGAFCQQGKMVHFWCDFDRASSLICGNKMPTTCNRGFYCRSYCLLNMFRASLYPSSGAQEYYTVVAACGISCSILQI